MTESSAAFHALACAARAPVVVAWYGEDLTTFTPSGLPTLCSGLRVVYLTRGPQGSPVQWIDPVFYTGPEQLPVMQHPLVIQLQEVGLTVSGRYGGEWLNCPFRVRAGMR